MWRLAFYLPVTFKYGKDCKELETMLKSIVPSHALSKTVLPDGYTETFSLNELDKVMEQVEKFIPKHSGVDSGPNNTGVPV